MNGVIAWFARNGVAANLLMVVILAGGILTVPGIKQEIFPELSSEAIQVSVEYPGAAPDEVEEAICMRIEEQIYGLTGIDTIESSSREGYGLVTAKLLTDADRQRVLDDLKTRVDAIDTFPEEAEEPQIREIIIRRQVVNVAVTGDTSERDLRKVAEQVRDEISQIEGITLVKLGNARPYEISIEISELTLRRHGLTFDDVAGAVRRSSLDLPGGSVKTEGGEILVRTKGQAYEGEEFEDITLLSRPDGTRLRLGDVAEVIDGFADTDQMSFFDGKPTILVQVFRVGDQGALDIAEKVGEYIAEARDRLPEGIALTPWQDDSKVLESRLDLMVRNGRMGLVFVFASLALFLRMRLAFWVALGIPISFLGTLWLLPALGMSINLISLFAFIVALGIVVDDAIVVGENIYTKIQEGKPSIDAAIEGAREVSTPVIFAVLTTVAAFLPLLIIPGRYGEIIEVIPAVVVTTLVFSLVESLLILPRHLSHFRRERDRPSPGSRRGPAGWWNSFQRAFGALLDRVVARLYRPGLARAIRWRYLTLSAGAFTLLVTMGLVAAGWVRFTFFPPVDADNVVAYLTMPQGTPVEVTRRALERLEEAALEVREELNREHAGELDDVFRHYLVSVGGQPFREAQNQNTGQDVSFSGSHLGEVNIELLPSEERGISSTRIARMWRDRVGPIPDARELTFESSIFASGKDVNIQLASTDLEELRSVADEMKEKLDTYRGVHDITDSFEPGKQELKLRLEPAAENFGLTLADLARQVRQGFYGEEVQRIQRGRDDVKVMVRYPREERRSLGDVENVRIRTPAGGEVPFSTVARAEIGRGYSAIHRSDRQRVITVSAGVDHETANATEINEELTESFLPELRGEYPRLTWSFAGDQKEQREAMARMIDGFVLALLFIYTLLAIPLRSYLQPVIIMSAIPFGVVGAVWGHILMGVQVTFLSLFGVVALTGVIVNDSLVMVDFINRKYRGGQDLFTAVRDSGVQRFRPILLTSLTTFAGLTPLLLERSLQAKFLIPMAISLGFGVIFATFITLGLVPIGYFIVDDLKRVFRKVFLGRGGESEPGATRSRLSSRR